MDDKNIQFPLYRHFEHWEGPEKAGATGQQKADAEKFLVFKRDLIKRLIELSHYDKVRKTDSSVYIGIMRFRRLIADLER